LIKPMRSATLASSMSPVSRYSRARVTDELRPDDGAAVASNIAHFHMRVAEARTIGPNRDVAQQRQRRAESDAVAVDALYHRLFQIELTEK
jgi:hypothetical protein